MTTGCGTGRNSCRTDEFTSRFQGRAFEPPVFRITGDPFWPDPAMVPFALARGGRVLDCIDSFPFDSPVASPLQLIV